MTSIAAVASKLALDNNFATLAENHESMIKIKDSYKVSCDAARDFI